MITILNVRARIGGATLILVGLLALMACGPDAGEDTSGVSVVATTSIWGDVAGRIVGEDGTVDVLMPLGADPHDYQPSAGEVAALHAADLVVANGLNLETGLEDVLDTAVADGVNVYEVAPDLDPLAFHTDEHHEDEDADHEHGDLDPHVWLDPTRVAMAARSLADRLAEIEPDVDWQARADTYVSEMESLDREIAALADSIPIEHRKLVTNHDALGYFAERYGFEVVGVVVPGGSTLAEPSSAELADLVAVIREQGVTAIFAETTNPTSLADAVADEVGEEVTVVELHTGSLGGPGSDAETLADMLLTDARRIAEALS